MSNSNNIFAITTVEKTQFRKIGIRLKDIGSYSVEELCDILDTSVTRAMEIHALIDFQTIPSIGIRFAHDLVSLGYYSLDQLKDKNGADLVNDFEQHVGYWIDPCVEDQCRLVVHFANNRDVTKRWWHFTAERKEFRSKHGYPVNRPKKAWFEISNPR